MSQVFREYVRSSFIEYKGCVTHTPYKCAILTSTRAGSPIHVSNVIDGGSFRAEEPRGTVQFQRRLVAIVLDVLTAVQRVRYQFLQHLRGELSVLDVEREVGLRDRADVDLRG